MLQVQQSRPNVEKAVENRPIKQNPKVYSALWISSCRFVVLYSRGSSLGAYSDSSDVDILSASINAIPVHQSKLGVVVRKKIIRVFDIVQRFSVNFLFVIERASNIRFKLMRLH